MVGFWGLAAKRRILPTLPLCTQLVVLLVDCLVPVDRLPYFQALGAAAGEEMGVLVVLFLVVVLADMADLAVPTDKADMAEVVRAAVQLGAI